VLVARLKLVHPPALLKVRETEPPPTLAVMSADWSVAWVGRRVLVRMPANKRKVAASRTAPVVRLVILTTLLIILFNAYLWFNIARYHYYIML